MNIKIKNLAKCDSENEIKILIFIKLKNTETIQHK